MVCAPFGLKLRQNTKFAWPLMVLSSLPVATCRAQAHHARVSAHSHPCYQPPGSSCLWRRIFTSQSLAVRSSDADATY
eukprot:scaffold50726_cov34-Tisochrysis_lutea.AAC.1